MRVLITGSAGQLGRELRLTVPPGYQVHYADRADVDVSDVSAVTARVQALKPAVIVNAAGYTAVDRAESERERAFGINATGAANLARAAAEHGARLIQISTDYVFDGERGRPYRVGDTAAPLSVYGQSKLEGERQVLSILGVDALVLRTAWLYSVHGGNFVKSILRRLADNAELSVVSDQIGTPTWAQGLAKAVWRATTRPPLNGIYHWTDAGVASWYDFAVAIQEEALALGLLSREARIVPIRTEEYPTPARRPPYSVLDKADTWRDFGLAPEHWRTNLRRMVAELRGV